MAQRVFSTIGTAADDVAAAFGDEAPDLSAAFMVWALQETVRQGGCAEQEKKPLRSVYASCAQCVGIHLSARKLSRRAARSTDLR
jgi:hypothetical protein